MPSKLRIGPINGATPTPLTADGELDLASMPLLARRWRDAGLDGVLLLGTMGEGLLLSDATRNRFIESAIEQAAGKVTLFAGTADLSRQRMRERALRYAKMGADCIVLCLPVNVPPAKAVADVKAVADASPIPCAFYDIPANTGTTLVLDEILDILRHENIVAMKDSSGNVLLAQAMTSAEHRPANVKLLHGIEYCTAWSAQIGYDGVLHGGGVLSARYVRAIWDHIAGGRRDEALKLDRENSLMLGQIYNRFTRPLQNVAGQKHALKLLGAMQSDIALEQSLDEASRRRIAAAVERHKSWLTGSHERK